ncbi:MAG: hypothetical protein HUJ70_03220 [Pseudobutyrivibrio sp.]|nr:hypothetical protein [Pseudobutyrivibrio sp.]
MILTYKDCIEKYGTDYMLKKELEAGRLFQKEKGLYSDEKRCSEAELIMAKYPRAVFAGESAHYYYGLTDVIPEEYVLATKRSDTRIKDTNVRQLFVNDELFDFAKTTMLYRGTEINIYSVERLLVDLIRSKQKLPFDYYKEVIGGFRNIAGTMDFFVVEEYASKFRGRKAIMNAIKLEVL